MTTSNQNVLERIFNLRANGTNVRTELMAGLTTFLAMCYIIIVNPLILGETGMDMGAVFVATCIASAIGCFVMGFVGNYPIALAPGMGLNAYFTFAVVKGMGVPWQVALGAVFVSGIIFILFSFFKVREMLVNALPMGLKMSIAAGIGLFLSLIALKGSGIIVASDATLVKLGDIHQPVALLVLAGFAMVVALGHFRVKGAIILTILALTAISTLLGLSEFKGVVGEIPSIAPTFMQMDFHRHAGRRFPPRGPAGRRQTASSETRPVRRLDRHRSRCRLGYVFNHALCRKRGGRVRRRPHRSDCRNRRRIDAGVSDFLAAGAEHPRFRHRARAALRRCANAAQRA